jgi:hypothetical protein
VIDHTTALYCIAAELLKASGHIDDIRSELIDAEVITTAQADLQAVAQGARQRPAPPVA